MHPLVQLARRAIETRLREGRAMEPPAAGEGSDRRAAAFVSLKKEGELRGCIGTLVPTAPSLAAEVARNAVEAALGDPRFPPVTLEELPGLTISVDELSPPEPVTSLDQLDPSRYGVIVQRGGRQGLLLPDLEGVDTVERQVGIAMAKAGIPPGAPWDEVHLFRFTVVRYH